ncbi:uncharacterized protein LOC141896925 isoform X2 [Acropora palmata]|uniref:uncharacterized protein LOC141896925 isoform X2 n=1 Tax=Acropora palmata TaxID=6131 RepID=UPI003DA01DC5
MHVNLFVRQFPAIFKSWLMREDDAFQFQAEGEVRFTFFVFILDRISPRRNCCEIMAQRVEGDNLPQGVEGTTPGTPPLIRRAREHEGASDDVLVQPIQGTSRDAAHVEKKKKPANEDRAGSSDKDQAKTKGRGKRKRKEYSDQDKAGTPPSVCRARQHEEASDDVLLPPKKKKTSRDTLQGLSKLRDEFPHFVNRKTDELSHIVVRLDPENKQCQGVFIDGAPGIGKTILATEAANKLRRDNRHVLVVYIDCKDINSFESFAATVIEQICRSPSVNDPAAEIKKRLEANKDYFHILFLDSFECFLEDNHNQQGGQPSTAAALSRDCKERVLRFIGEIARRPTNIKFLVTSSERVFFPTLAMETIHLNPFDKGVSSKLLEKVGSADKISVEDLCNICSGIPLVLHIVISLQEDLKCFVKLPRDQRTNFLGKMKTVPQGKKIELCLNHCYQRLTPQVRLTLLHLCLYRGLFTPDKAAEIFCSSKSSENDLRNNVLELGLCNLLHQQKSQDTVKYTFLTVIRENISN